MSPEDEARAAQPVCGFCQGDGTEIVRPHTPEAHWITCTHCGGKGTGLTREQAEARQFRIGRVVTYLAGKGHVRAEVDVAHWLDISLDEAREALAWIDAAQRGRSAEPPSTGNEG